MPVKDVQLIFSHQVFAASLDLKDAYWHIPVKKLDKKYIGFLLDREKYHFRVPFSLNIPSGVFTNITKPILMVGLV